MKPIIIEIKDGKVVMNVHEFKKHIEDTYQQGYSDGCSSSITTYNDPYWWRQLTTTNLNISTTDTTTPTATLADKITANDELCRGILDACAGNVRSRAVK